MCAKKSRCLPADISKSDQADAAVSELEKISVLHIVFFDGDLPPLPHSCVVSDHIVQHTEHKEDRLLRNGSGVHSLAVAHIDPAALCRFRIDQMKCYPFGVDQLQIRHVFDQLRCDRRDRISDDKIRVLSVFQILSRCQPGGKIYAVHFSDKTIRGNVAVHHALFSYVQYFHDVSLPSSVNYRYSNTFPGICPQRSE